MVLIAGLGNPGPGHAGNRHNIGFMAADAIARRHSLSAWTKKFKAEIASGDIAGEKVLVVKPLTFMNLSGESVGEAMRFYKLAPADLIVIHDDLDLSAGRARIKTGGGHGGHNGLKSIDAHCGRDYRRLRLGIGHPGPKEMVHNHVLGDFSKIDAEWLDPLIEAIGENAELLVGGKDSQFLNKLVLALENAPEIPAAKPAKKPAQSHIRQARQGKPKDMPKAGPMADMLKKMFGDKE